ncbi:gliding motility-associated ABC transporter substrate-binding protein GldG [Hanstruepera ponticola]|uniref:gliding motility-associated ABC transporter substrate-binding protein GldG n=1 Tax=Hanstruepera ponticola TaxID=2042995 RepID=UPI00177C7D7B|nr:gliding motility-associated ABC transporter substrate-binding protein GldG [Hanstruepera ponticola]
MLAILRKEINSFFASPIGYLVIAIFLTLNGLFLWLFSGEFNILDNGFADMSSFFLLAPWILIFLIPAVTMRSFADEKKQGTLELLLTKPISDLKIVFGKYFGTILLIIVAILPTLLYVYTVYELGNPIGNIDFGSTLGSYFGLLFLIAAYTAIGVFSSSITDNQIVAFITAVFLCFLFYIGFEGIADILSSSFLEQLGMSTHYKSMSRGVIDTRDILYFVSITLFFILLTNLNISTKKFDKKRLTSIVILFLGLLVLNIFTQSIYKRFDLTSDKRYTLSDAAKQTITTVESPIVIDVFLDGTNLPSEFRRLQMETKQLLDEFVSENNQIIYNFINPLEDDNSRERNIQQLTNRGLTPMQVTVQEAGKSSQEVVFPWALASYNNTTVKIPLVKNKIGATIQEIAISSIQHLEYAFADGFSKLVNPKRRKIAILKGNNQLQDPYLFDFVKTLKDYYFIAPFTLDSVAESPQKTLNELKAYDLIISAKPTEAFSEKEKYALDQYTMNGGKSLWLIDAVAMEQDSLYNASGKAIATSRDLNLTDFFFKYGIRINPVLINDLYSAQITLATGEGSQSQFQQFPWFYSPLVNPTLKHPIINNLNLIKFDFANQIDTLKNPTSVDKTILLQSSILSKIDGTPREISLEMTTQEPNPELYSKGNQNLAVLLEGEFTSVYNNRVKPFEISNDKPSSMLTKMIVIADGDIIKNEIGRNGPQELGFDRWNGQTYGNKELLLNAVNYLLDDDGLINIRSKEVTVAFLDDQKIAAEKSKWQTLNIALPLVFLAIFGWLFNYFRKKKYAH